MYRTPHDADTDTQEVPKTNHGELPENTLEFSPRRPQVCPRPTADSGTFCYVGPTEVG